MVTTTCPAHDICCAFFKAMDLDSNGFIEKPEIIKISTTAFGETPEAAEARWNTMIKDMDKNEDQKISMEEYAAWWEKDTAEKKEADGTFVKGYAEYLLNKLETLQKVQG